MKNLVVSLVILVAFSLGAVAQTSKLTGLQTTAFVTTICTDYQVGMNNGREDFDTPEQQSNAILCLGFVTGVMNSMSGQYVFLDPAHTKLVIGNWDNTGPDKMVDAFLEFVKSNPKILDQPAIETIRAAALTYGLYQYTIVKAKGDIVVTEN